ncbi:hypothetical protein PILCRDRAFT_825525 [Piloderma croceum F 1598]|uniref:Uncharacterized protein n=1 Tax=Piloderma croceum (strain F 1598) TaxID=765440 RepID=A0A0C3BIK6_PILCF|nr:hypothetical protein PILCRDRAFT_825525 [Piloderma croceum F 1598]
MHDRAQIHDSTTERVTGFQLQVLLQPYRYLSRFTFASQWTSFGSTHPGARINQ